MDSKQQEDIEARQPLNAPDTTSDADASATTVSSPTGAKEDGGGPTRFSVKKVDTSPKHLEVGGGGGGGGGDGPHAEDDEGGRRGSGDSIGRTSTSVMFDDSSNVIIEVPSRNGDNVNQNKDHLPLAENEESIVGNMALYEDDLTRQGRISHILNRITAYQAGIAPNVSDVEQGKGKPKANLGTVLGVYLPCIQNIFGILLFVRMTWIVGMAGAVESLFIVAICCSATLLTAVSMSAIATNGVVPAGGSYFMISRALGPEFGGAVGVLFYLGTSVASSMYIVGAVEILLKYMAPDMNVFGDVVNGYRVYGTVIMLMLSFVVFVGVGFVSKFAALSLACVIISILSIYLGIFVSNPDSSVEICVFGGRLMTLDAVTVNGSMSCTKNTTGAIYQLYCNGVNDTSESCDFFKRTDVHAIVHKGIPGLASGLFTENVLNKYTQLGDIIGLDRPGSAARGEIVAEITTSFMVLLAIYFPSVTGCSIVGKCLERTSKGGYQHLMGGHETFMVLLVIYFPSVTGIMAGSNRSGDLADAQKSIPTGTIFAIITTSFVYLTSVLFFAACIHGDLLRDKYGVSIGGELIIGKLAWPNEWVIMVGAFLSTLGAGLQTLTGAPRLLQAIAKDGVIPFLGLFSKTTKKGEPFRALLMTGLISELGILIGNLDYIAPIITMFFLMCYGFVNMACAMLTLLQTPNWRPRFRFYHWTLSLLGVTLCIVMMFISSWYYALAAIAVAVCIYKYIEYKGAEQEWGDGIRGLAMSAARYSLLRLQSGPPHTKNWRPQLLVLMKMDENLKPKYPKLALFAGQLKAGKGLCLVNSVLEGSFRERYSDAQASKQELNTLVREYGVKGFSDVSISKDVTEGLCQLIQNAGLGGLKHNTVVIGWPYGWRHQSDRNAYKVFLDTAKNVGAGQMALLVPKGIAQFPEQGTKLRGTIDVWWIVHDGGLLMLLPFLLKQDKTWKNCKLRIFTVAQTEDNSIQMKKDLITYLYQLRIEADVDVVEMSTQDISAYTYERTLIMEQRMDMLNHIRNQQNKQKPPSEMAPNYPTITLSPVPEESNTEEDFTERNRVSLDKSQFTFTPQEGKSFVNTNKKPDKHNVRRMHTAVRLNEHIVEKSHNAQLVILNLPAPPKTEEGEQNYMEFLEVLTEGIDRVLMVRGSGREVITIYS